MTSGRDPPFYICFEVFDDNLEKFRGIKDLSHTVFDWLQIQFPDMPFVLSPLHLPEDSKPHVHGIAEIYLDSGITFDSFSACFKAYNLPRPELCNSVIGAELYLTHDSTKARLECKQKFSVAERQTMLYACGYKLHKQTARDKADSVSVVVSYVSDKIYEKIYSDPYLDTDDLFCMVRKPDFYSDLVCDLPFDLIVAKGKNEVKVHYRLYLKIAEDLRKKQPKKPCLNELSIFCNAVISDSITNKDDTILRQIHYNLWANFPKYRILLASNSSGHYSYGKNLRLAVGYFQNYEPDMLKVYNMFLEIVRK